MNGSQRFKGVEGCLNTGLKLGYGLYPSCMAVQKQLFRETALNAWYEAAKPALFLNKTLREWLQLYSEPQRPEAVKLALIHGIICLRKSFGQKALSIQELKQATENGHHAVTLSEELPMLKNDLAHIQHMLSGFEEPLLSANMVEFLTLARCKSN